jgi:hypothetical protein
MSWKFILHTLVGVQEKYDVDDNSIQAAIKKVKCVRVKSICRSSHTRDHIQNPSMS